MGLLLWLSVLVAVLSAGFYFAAHHTPAAGTVPLLNFGVKPGYEFKDIPYLGGKNYVVTGSNAGIGKSIVKLLAKSGAHVVMACRSIPKCEAAKEEIDKVTHAGGNLVTMPLDLGDLKSVRSFARDLKIRKLDGLILNAGFIAQRYRLAATGLEESFQVNHLSQFELTRLLMDKLKQSTPSTVVALSSSAHEVPLKNKEGVPLSKAEINSPNGFDAMHAYGASKLANILFVKELDRRFYEQGIIANAVHPGMVASSFYHKMVDEAADSKFGKILQVFAGLVDKGLYWDCDTAALSAVYAAISPRVHGKYLIPVAREFPPNQVQPLKDMMSTAKKFWIFSEKLLEEL